MPRMPNAQFDELLDEVRNASAQEKLSIRYYAGLAYQRDKYGNYVYVHRDAPTYPKMFDVWVGDWGRSKNQYHSDVKLCYNGFGFAYKRLHRIFQATLT